MGAVGLPPAPQCLTGKTQAAQDGLDITCGSAALMLGVPPREIDISWVSLCVPLRPGKNSFVMMRWVRYLCAFPEGLVATVVLGGFTLPSRHQY